MRFDCLVIIGGVRQYRHFLLLTSSAALPAGNWQHECHRHISWTGTFFFDVVIQCCALVCWHNMDQYWDCCHWMRIFDAIKIR